MFNSSTWNGTRMETKQQTTAVTAFITTKGKHTQLNHPMLQHQGQLALVSFIRKTLMWIAYPIQQIPRLENIRDMKHYT